MITKKVICDRCKKVILDSENEQTDGKELGYAEVNIVRFDGKTTSTMHFCEDCYMVAVNAWNEKQ